MKLIKKSEGTLNQPEKHFNMLSNRKVEVDKDSQRLSVSVAHFLPNGGIEKSSTPTEKTYYIISGAMMVTTKSGEYLLQEGDIAYFAPNEERTVRISGNDVCTVLVCIVKT